MNRIVYFHKDLQLIARDKFGTNLSDFINFKAGKNELMILDKDAYYQSKDNERFYIYDGVGELDLRKDCIKKYAFEYLNPAFVDHFLATTHYPRLADKSDKRLIDDFLFLFDKHLRGDKKINPPYFEEIIGCLDLGKLNLEN